MEYPPDILRIPQLETFVDNTTAQDVAKRAEIDLVEEHPAGEGNYEEVIIDGNGLGELDYSSNTCGPRKGGKSCNSLSYQRCCNSNGNCVGSPVSCLLSHGCQPLFGYCKGM